jgi:hypothetical protein
VLALHHILVLGSNVDEFSPFSWAENSPIYGVRLHKVELLEQRRGKECASFVATRGVKGSFSYLY